MESQRARVVPSPPPAPVRWSGDARAFERLYDEHSGTVYRIAMRILGNAVQAQDVVQDVFMRMWRQPYAFDAARGSLAGYLKLMARSRALDVWRERQVAGRAHARLKLLAARADDRPETRPPAAV